MEEERRARGRGRKSSPCNHNCHGKRWDMANKALRSQLGSVLPAAGEMPHPLGPLPLWSLRLPVPSPELSEHCSAAREPSSKDLTGTGTVGREPPRNNNHLAGIARSLLLLTQPDSRLCSAQARAAAASSSVRADLLQRKR